MSTCIFSPCRTWRYSLQRNLQATMLTEDLRRLGYQTPGLVAVMLNPSTADEDTNDPTIRRLISYCEAHGRVRLVVLNLFGFRATDPSDLTRAADPIGHGNDVIIEATVRQAQQERWPLLAAWGIHGTKWNRCWQLDEKLGHPNWHCFGTTQTGMPRHPLYLPKTVSMVPYRLPPRDVPEIDVTKLPGRP